MTPTPNTTVKDHAFAQALVYIAVQVWISLDPKTHHMSMEMYGALCITASTFITAFIPHPILDKLDKIAPPVTRTDAGAPAKGDQS